MSVRYSAVVNRTHIRMILFRSALAIASGFKQVMTSLVLLSFATQLSRKEGITIPKITSSEHWDNTMVMLNENSEFILATHSKTNWKIDVWKTGGSIYFSPASTSPDMTQPADNINSITTRHESKTVVQNNDVVYYAAAMQTQSTVRDDKEYPVASQHNTFVIKDAIKEVRKSSASIQFCRLRSRDVVNCEPLLPSQHSETEGAVAVYCFLDTSFCNYGNQYAAQFPEGIITNYEEMEIIGLDKMECSYVAAQCNSGGNGIVQKSVIKHSMETKRGGHMQGQHTASEKDTSSQLLNAKCGRYRRRRCALHRRARRRLRTTRWTLLQSQATSSQAPHKLA